MRFSRQMFPLPHAERAPRALSTVIGLLALISVALPTIAVADQTIRAPIMTVQQSHTSSCTCRFEGRDYSVGEMACIRGKSAMCDRVLNNTSWTFSSEACPAMSLLDENHTVLASVRRLDNQ